MVLLFLGSPRSMLIVITSIPLSILTAIVALKLTGQTINTMTLGGIALAVGMLVDDATVEIENIHRNHAMSKPLLVAILDGASQIATPTFVGTLSICIVFFPVVLLTGVAKFLFTPLALAVVFAMLTSYLLSRTLVPTMARYLLPDDHEDHLGHGRWGNLVRAFDRRFERREGALPGRAGDLHRPARPGADLRRDTDRAFARTVADRGRGFLPGRRCGHDAAARARAHRYPDRAHRISGRSNRSHHPHDHSGRRTREHQRQYRPARVLRPRLLSDRQHRPAGRRRADPAQAEASADRDCTNSGFAMRWRRSIRR